MRKTIHNIVTSPGFRSAMIAPVALMLIFSFFNLSAAPDPDRIAGSITIGVVNHDTGMTFPPIKISSRIMAGMAENLPFGVRNFATDAAARAALETGDISAAIIFPADFSKFTASGDPIEITILNSQHLSLMETSIAGQLPMLLQSALSAAVATVRLSLEKGQLPSGGFPVTANVETLYTANNGAALAAPFVVSFASWLAAMVGAMLIFLATKDSHNGKARAIIRSLPPIISALIASVVLATLVCWTSGNWAIFIKLWASAWIILLSLSWLLAGLFAVFNMLAMLIILPMVFFQTAIGGAQAPVKAAPDWLRGIGEMIPFDVVSQTYRTIIIGGNAPFPWLILLATAGIGLTLIWVGSLALGPKK